jgi:predicted CxxxxCH...CXXCH cytochrome family protein
MRLTNPWGAAALAVCALAACGEARDVVGFTGAQSSCASCHTAPDEGPPFRNRAGQLETAGSHDRHIAGGISAPIQCSECHVIPRGLAEPTHIDGVPTVTFAGTLARTGGAPATSCGTTYCHGGAFAGVNNIPLWFAAKPVDDTCGTCHGFPPASGLHVQHVGAEYGTGDPRPTVTCNDCHGALLRATHVNGIKNIVTNNLLQSYDPPTKTCSSVACHPSVGVSSGAAWPP